jgi:hypothetical protein
MNNIFKSDKPPSPPPLEPTTFLIKPGNDEAGVWLMNANVSLVEDIISSVGNIIRETMEKDMKMNDIIERLKKI